MASLKLAQQSQNLGHYAHAADLYQKLLENPNLSKKIAEGFPSAIFMLVFTQAF